MKREIPTYDRSLQYTTWEHKDVLDKKSMSFQEYVWLLVRNVPEVEHMRHQGRYDPPVSLPPELGFYTMETRICREKVREMKTWDDARWLAERKKDNAEIVLRHNAYVRKVRPIVKRYNAMIESVTAWDPPTPKHRKLKVFLLERLNRDKPYPIGKPDIYTSTKVYKEKMMDHFSTWIGHYGRSAQIYDFTPKEIRAHRQWILDLHRSVPCPTGSPKPADHVGFR